MLFLLIATAALSKDFTFYEVRGHDTTIFQANVNVNVNANANVSFRFGGGYGGYEWIITAYAGLAG
jgi:hypothetical protein